MKALTPTYKFKIEVRMSTSVKCINYKYRDVHEYYYVGKSKNGKDLFVSETCKRRATVIKTIKSLFGNITIIDKTK